MSTTSGPSTHEVEVAELQGCVVGDLTRGAVAEHPRRTQHLASGLGVGPEPLHQLSVELHIAASRRRQIPGMHGCVGHDASAVDSENVQSKEAPSKKAPSKKAKSTEAKSTEAKSTEAKSTESTATDAGSETRGQSATRVTGQKGAMMQQRKWLTAIVGIGLMLAVVGVSIAQFGQFGRGRSRGYSSERFRARHYDQDGKLYRNGVPEWKNDRDFKRDTFTFVRIRYTSAGRGWGWDTDFPDSDLNFSFRLQQLTSMKVDPEGKILELTSPELFNYPFIYMIEVGNLAFSAEEVVALRRYLTNGGFLMVDDFWGDWAWYNFEDEIRKVFPDRQIIDVPLDHEIFNTVYPLGQKFKNKNELQIPAIGWAHRGRASGMTWEPTRDGSDSSEVHYRAITDDKGRIMVFACHNTDLGDGWEREGEDEWYFREFSEKKAYPLGINIITYAMTH